MILDDSRCLREGSATCSVVHSVSGGISQTRSRHEDHMADNGSFWLSVAVSDNDVPIT
ncbi:hypothetical protein PV326_005968, partial [Microctonus aethiopoides]